MNLLRAIVRIPSRIAIGLIRVYQLTLSPLLGPRCRFHPSCSRYACACLRDHGFVRGSWLTLARLSRCGPWHPGGYDPPPPARELRDRPKDVPVMPANNPAGTPVGTPAGTPVGTPIGTLESSAEEVG